MSARNLAFIAFYAMLIGFESSSFGETNGSLALFARQIAPADRIIATNWAASRFGEPGFGIPVTRNKVKKIIGTVSAATRYGDQEHPDFEWDWQLQFYRGTNLLGSFCFGRDTFLMDGVCRDSTGLLAEIYRESVNREYVARVYNDEDKEFATTRKAEARKWLRSSLHSIRGEGKEKVNQFVDHFYGAGARKVYVAGITKPPLGKNGIEENAKYLLVALPHDAETRRKVFAVHWEAVRAWGIDADDDVGQKYLWYQIDWSEPR